MDEPPVPILICVRGRKRGRANGKGVPLDDTAAIDECISGISSGDALVVRADELEMRADNRGIWDILKRRLRYDSVDPQSPRGDA